VEYANNSNCRLGYDVGGDIRRTADDEFACAGNSTNAPTGGKIKQTTGGCDYQFIDQDGSCGIICLDVCEDGVTIR
jgi:hypothetical protein